MDRQPCCRIQPTCPGFRRWTPDVRPGSTFVEFLAQPADDLGVLGQLFLTPAVGDGAKKRDENRQRGDDDPLGQSHFHQVRIFSPALGKIRSE